MSNRRRLILIVATILAVLWLGLLIFSRSNVRLAVHPDSQLTAIRVSANSQTAIDLPATIRLRTGKHELVFSGPGGEAHRREVWVIPPFPRHLQISLGVPELPGLDQYLDVPYLGLFPYQSDDFEIIATTSSQNGEIAIIALTIFAIHHFEGPEDGQAYVDERNIAVSAAKKWLKDQGVPETIPIEIKDR